MSKLDQPLKVKHGLAAVAAALILGATATAIPMATARSGGNPFLHYVHVVRTVTANGQDNEVANCPQGTHVVGGGVEGTAPFASGRGQMINTSKPFDDHDNNHAPDDGWFGTMDNFQNAGGEKMKVFAVCKE